MKTKFLSVLKERCKDFGLTEQAINDLVELGIEGLTEESSEEDFSKKADSLVPFAKMMQKEITRKSAKKKPSEEKPSKPEGENKEGEGDGEAMPAWAKAMQESLNALTQENAKLKADQAKSERQAMILSKSKQMGIPEYLMKRMSIADDADIDAELTSIKQDLVNNNLLPKDATAEKPNMEAELKSDAEAWAKQFAK